MALCVTAQHSNAFQTKRTASGLLPSPLGHSLVRTKAHGVSPRPPRRQSTWVRILTFPRWLRPWTSHLSSENQFFIDSTELPQGFIKIIHMQSLARCPEPRKGLKLEVLMTVVNTVTPQNDRMIVEIELVRIYSTWRTHSWFETPATVWR